MKLTLLKILGLFIVLLFCTPQNAFAQRTKTTAVDSVKISAADQKAITALFKGVDASKYRLQFNNKKTVVGKRSVKMEDLEQVRKVTNPAEAAGWIVFVVEGDDVIYVLAVGNSELVSVLGREKAAQLNKIMAKYKR
ncbi:MAG: hypothetical protein SFU99_17460 [Saprospiraceae bacterium]|nr:hypothetical protein [Saprospiraceae bacterium]